MSSQEWDEDSFDAWWRDALCAETGADLFFVGQGQSVIEAKKVCAMCPVRAKCLADALESDVEYGIFGGFARPARIPLRLLVERGKDSLVVAEAAIKRDNDRWKRRRWR